MFTLGILAYISSVFFYSESEAVPDRGRRPQQDDTTAALPGDVPGDVDDSK